jgi:outer membrane lipoprotein-sorting protein
MRRSAVRALAPLTLAAAIAASPAPARQTADAPPTAEDIVAKSIRARGGLGKIRAVETLRMTGTMLVGEDRLPTTVEWKRPAKTRWEFEADGQTAIQVYDGKMGWTLMPFEGNTDPEQMSDSELEDVALQADLDGPLVDPEKKGNKIELIGKEDADGRAAWKLKVTRKNGEERIVYIDAETYLQTLTVTKRDMGGHTVEIKSVIDDYRSVDGLMLPHSFDASAPGMPQGQSLRFSKAEINVPIDDSRFEKPSVDKPEKGKPAPTPEPQTPSAPTR